MGAIIIIPISQVGESRVAGAPPPHGVDPRTLRPSRWALVGFWGSGQQWGGGATPRSSAVPSLLTFLTLWGCPRQTFSSRFQAGTGLRSNSCRAGLMGAAGVWETLDLLWLGRESPGRSPRHPGERADQLRPRLPVLELDSWLGWQRNLLEGPQKG